MAVGWGVSWPAYVATHRWEALGLPELLEYAMLSGVLALMLGVVTYLEYRVDWAALQREVEARTGASSASA